MRIYEKVILLSKLNGLKYCNQAKMSKDSRIHVLPVCRLAELAEDAVKENNSKLINTLTHMGADNNNIFFLDDTIKPDPATIADIEKSDFVIIPGGRMETGIAKLREYNLDDVLRNYPGIIVGISAGALLLFPQYIVTPNWAYPMMEVCDGLGIVEKDWFIEVHYDENDTKQMESLNKIKSIVATDIYGIKNTGYIFINEDGALFYKDVIKI